MRTEAMPRADPAFLIVGTPRSGTTLIQRLACELPGVMVPPETEFFEWFARAVLRRRRFPLNETALREELAAYARRQGFRGLSLDIESIVDELGGRCEDLVTMFRSIVRQLAGNAPVTGEKTPVHLLWWRPLTRAMPHLKIIAVVRDPRAVAASHLTVPWGTRPHLKFAARWASEQREVMRARRALGPERFLLLRYEDVVRDPARARTELASFLGISLEAGTPSDAKPGARRIYLEWEWWKDGVWGPISSERVESWRESLPGAHSAQIVSICRREMRRLGYPTEGYGEGAPRPNHLPLSARAMSIRFRAGILVRAHHRRKVARAGIRAQRRR